MLFLLPLSVLGLCVFIITMFRTALVSHLTKRSTLDHYYEFLLVVLPILFVGVMLFIGWGIHSSMLTKYKPIGSAEMAMKGLTGLVVLYLLSFLWKCRKLITGEGNNDHVTNNVD